MGVEGGIPSSAHSLKNGMSKSKESNLRLIMFIFDSIKRRESEN
jgi:hypothetical protein